MTEFNNAIRTAKIFYARHMFPGTVEYADERILVDEQAVLKMQPTFKGKPVYLGHDRYMNDRALPVEQQKPDGYISDSFRNGLDSWSWVKFVVSSDEVARKIEQENYAVSNGWLPKQWEQHSGTFHNVKYDRRLREGEYTHLAIERDPRYEEAKVFTEAQYQTHVKALKASHELHNSKEKKPMLKLFRTKKEEIEMDNLEDVSVEVGGKSVTIMDMLNAVVADEQRQADKTPEEVAAEQAAEQEKQNAALLATEVDVNGTKMTVAELQTKYAELQEKQNAADALKDAEAAEAQRAAEEKAEADAKAAAAEDAAKQKQFDELQNAAHRGAPPQVIETRADREKRGQTNYGSNS